MVWKSSKQVWAQLHEEAFRYFGGATQYVVRDFVPGNKIEDAASGDATERRECSCMRVEQHLVTLRVIAHEPECATCGELHVCDFYPAPQATDEDVFAAPVELECLSVFKGKRHEGTSQRALVSV